MCSCLRVPQLTYTALDRLGMAQVILAGCLGVLKSLANDILKVRIHVALRARLPAKENPRPRGGAWSFNSSFARTAILLWSNRERRVNACWAWVVTAGGHYRRVFAVMVHERLGIVVDVEIRSHLC